MSLLSGSSDAGGVCGVVYDDRGVFLGVGGSSFFLLLLWECGCCVFCSVLFLLYGCVV